MKILVIGGAGYIGSALIPFLLRDGHSVRLYDRFIYGADSIAAFRREIEIVGADFRDIGMVRCAMENIDMVIHLGAIVGDKACDLDEQLTLDINYSAASNIARMAKNIGIDRMIFSSTCSVYGAADDWLNESSELNPVSLYARSKIKAERELIDMADNKFCLSILRFGTVYGISGRTRFDLVVNLLTAKAVRDGEITIFGGDQWRPFVHVQDAALAISHVASLSKPSVNYRIFNVGSNTQNYQIRDIGKIIKDAVDGSKIVSCGTDHDKRNYKVKFDKIAQTGYRPKLEIIDGIEQVKKIFEEKNIDYKDPRYNNFLALRDLGALEILQNFRKKVG